MLRLPITLLLKAKRSLLATVLAALSLITGCTLDTESRTKSLTIINDQNLIIDRFFGDNAWFTDAALRVEYRDELLNNNGLKQTSARNIILFVGDGMSLSTIAAARIFEAQQRGEFGEENELSFERFPFTGLAKPYNVDAQTPDSAGTMTAMMSGIKTDMGVIGLTEFASRGRCEPSLHHAPTALELAELAGKKTGIVTTARVTHATPAATYAHLADRNWEDISDMPEEAVAAGCLDIADQFVRFPILMEERYGVAIDGPDVVFGGGRRHFLPNHADYNSLDAASPIEGDRNDGRNLIAEWQNIHPQGQVVLDQADFSALVRSSVRGPVLGLFNESHMRFEADRKHDTLGEPSLSEMTSKALDLLENSEKGYFLMVESGRIDHAHHVGNAFNALNETVELATAVRMASERTNSSDTLIIVTSDHGHVMTFAGYPRRGNPILGKVITPGENEVMLAADGMPYTTLSYANGLGFYEDSGSDPESRYEHAANHGRYDISEVNTQAPSYHQEALVPLSAETHSGEDVAVYAQGPGAVLVSGVNEQNVIFHIMNRAAHLTQEAAARLAMHDNNKN